MLRINNTPIGNLKQGDIVQFANKQWYVIGTDGNNEVSLLATNSLTKMEFGVSNNYLKSKVREYLSKLTTTEMIPQILLCEGQEIEEKLFLLNYEEAMCLPSDINKCNYSWWLRSPYHNTLISVWIVADSGSWLYYGLANYTHGIRPACVVNINVLKDEE